MMNGKLLEIVACPPCHGRLEYDEQHQRLICRFEKLAYPIKNGIPVLLAEQAETLSPSEEK
jgi:UPF0434 protein HS_0657